MGGFKFQGHLRQESGGVLVDIKANLPHNVSARWQIHELPVHFTVDPKLRCGPEYVGRALPYSGISGQPSTINGKTTASLILQSIVLYVDDQPAACGSIVPFILPLSAGVIDINSGVFGRIYVVQWPGECMLQIAHALVSLYLHGYGCLCHFHSIFCDHGAWFLFTLPCGILVMVG